MNHNITLQEIYDDLEGCLDLLATIGGAWRREDFDEVYANFAAMSPRMERATKHLRKYIESKNKDFTIDTSQMDKELEEIEMTWGHTRTKPEFEFIADEICIIRKDGISNNRKESLKQLQASSKHYDATEPRVRALWEKMTALPLVRLGWGGLQENYATFKSEEGALVALDCSRIALLRHLTNFDMVGLSLIEDPESIVFYRSDHEEPVATMVLGDNLPT